MTRLSPTYVGAALAAMMAPAVAMGGDAEEMDTSPSQISDLPQFVINHLKCIVGPPALEIMETPGLSREERKKRLETITAYGFLLPPEEVEKTLNSTEKEREEGRRFIQKNCQQPYTP
ncbi:MAG: hypothetical protein H6853_07655 [Rhodospirillales bacterium]|nr:hypothetical protein [Alphaproteobacteria bacterium]USO03395.1 MAG: hypothetical protein H6853_07655 [Rhodospirillales bacterium]